MVKKFEVKKEIISWWWIKIKILEFLEFLASSTFSTFDEIFLECEVFFCCLDDPEEDPCHETVQTDGGPRQLRPCPQ